MYASTNRALQGTSGSFPQGHSRLYGIIRSYRLTGYPSYKPPMERGFTVKYFLTVLTLTAVFFVSQIHPGFAEEDAETKGLKELCKNKNSTACFKLGERFRIVERDNKTALPYYLQSCETGHLDGCNYAGILTTANGKQYSPEWKEAARMFKITCDKDQEIGCFNLGALKYKEGRQSAAKKYFKKACDLGHLTSCDNYERLIK